MSDQEENVRVLIAEDDYMVSEMIRGSLEEIGCTIVGEAADGSEAVEMTQSLRPDVVLMDIKMPDMDGLEATRRIYQHCPTPVVVLTAYDTPGLVEEASAAGVGAYLVKPSSVREMERAIAISLARFDDMMELRDYADQLEQRVAERTAQLQAQYARLDAILRSTADGIAVTDARGEIIQTNPVAQAWLTQTLSPEDAARLQEAVQHLARRAAERPEAVLELTGLDLELQAAPILEPGLEEALRLAQGEMAAVVAVHDVSHLKALDRMKSRFVINISHELRTPITTIKLYADLMHRRPEKREVYLDTLARETDHLAGLVEGILQIARIDSGRLEMKPRPTLLNELAEAAVAHHQPLAQKHGLTLEHHPAEPGPLALVDPDQGLQVLNNLVKNGILYTPRGEQVVVSTGKAEAEGRAWATATVSDTGMGIPEDELPHIFDRFFRGKEPRSMQISGAGLGLSIVEEIVELHGGRVTVESEMDVGTTVTVWLPLADT